MPLNRCHVPSAPDISDCPSPQENSGGKKLTQAVQGFLGIFAVGFVAFLHMNFQSYYLTNQSVRVIQNRYRKKMQNQVNNKSVSEKSSSLLSNPPQQKMY